MSLKARIESLIEKYEYYLDCDQSKNYLQPRPETSPKHAIREMLEFLKEMNKEEHKDGPDAV